MEKLGEFIVNHWVLVTLFVVLVWMIMSDPLNRKLSGVATLGVTQAIQIVNQQNGLFLDIRETVEFDKEHIAASTNLPLSKLTGGASLLTDPAQPIILVCTSGQRARTATKQLRSSGFSEIYVLGGGLNAWKDAKLPLFS